MKDLVSYYSPENNDVLFVQETQIPKMPLRVRFGALGRALWEDHIRILKERKSEEKEREIHPVLSAAKYLLATGVESLPGPFAGYGVGDIVTGLEAVIGKTLDGTDLSLSERGIYAIATAIPGVPGRPIVTIYRQLDKHIISPFIFDHILKEKDSNSVKTKAAIYTPRRDKFFTPQSKPQFV